MGYGLIIAPFDFVGLPFIPIFHHHFKHLHSTLINQIFISLIRTSGSAQHVSWLTRHQLAANHSSLLVIADMQVLLLHLHPLQLYHLHRNLREIELHRLRTTRSTTVLIIHFPFLPLNDLFPNSHRWCQVLRFLGVAPKVSDQNGSVKNPKKLVVFS